MRWNSLKNPPKREGQENESRLLKFAKFVGNELIRLDEGQYNFIQERYYYEQDVCSNEHGITVNCTHWMYDYEDYWRLLEGIPKDEEGCY